MNIFIFLALVILLMYVLRIRKFNAGWRLYPDFITGSTAHYPTVSVVIAFRDEISHLPELLACLKNQAYPSDKVEYILVDDHSSDGSDKIAEAFCAQHQGYYLYRNSMGQDGKKQALINGISAAKHALIITTDADCRMNEQWISTFAAFYAEKKPDLIIGLVDLNVPRGFWQGFQETEFISLVASGAGSAALGMPVYCNGANMAFSKHAYSMIADPLSHSIASGDDTFLLHSLKRAEKKIMLLKSRASLVHTFGEKTFAGYIRQRMRWAYKGRYYNDREALFLAFLVLCVNVVVLSSLAYAIFTGNAGPFIFIHSVKLATDYIFLRNFMKYLRKKPVLYRYIVYSLMYPFYMVMVAIAAMPGRFRWKGRLLRK